MPGDLYDVTKVATEGLCRGVAAALGVLCVILLVPLFFPGPPHQTATYRLYKGVDLRDIVAAHSLALQAASAGCQV